MNVDLFDFALPEKLIAQTPLSERTASRLLALNKSDGTIEHETFSRLSHYLRPGDVLVLNNTKVMPARLLGIKPESGAKAEVLLLKQVTGDDWEALVKPGKRLKVGSTIEFGEPQAAGPLLKAEIMEEMDMGRRILRFQYQGIFHEILEQLGKMPLPPYIKEQLTDQERYQTVYASERGSAAAPTAGLHFTESYLKLLEELGVTLAYVTLHVGLGTFRPVSVEHVEEHAMHHEFYQFPEETAVVINEAKRQGRRVVAVGTTSVRTLETVAGQWEGKPLEACSGWTDIFIYPGYTFKLVDAILTNFHLPKSTLMMLISAFASREMILQAYKEAADREYRFFSFGDAMFIHD